MRTKVSVVQRTGVSVMKPITKVIINLEARQYGAKGQRCYLKSNARRFANLAQFPRTEACNLVRVD